MSQPIRLSVSNATTLRWPGLRKILDGEEIDPRTLYTVRFQFLPVGIAAAFGTWTNGTWDDFAPTFGPYSASITVGAGQPAPVNPGAGTWAMWAQLVAGNGSEDPAFALPPPVIFSTP